MAEDGSRPITGRLYLRKELQDPRQVLAGFKFFADFSTLKNYQTCRSSRDII